MPQWRKLLLDSDITSGILSVIAPLNTDNTRSVIGGTLAISMTTSSASSAGYLTSTDWGTFNNKLNASAFSGLTKISVGITTPGSPTTGDLWVDTN